MNLTFLGSTSNLMRNPNGTLRIGRWWGIAPNVTHWTCEGNAGGAGAPSGNHPSTAAYHARRGTSWTNRSLAGVWYDASVGWEFSEDYPYYDPEYMWSYGRAVVAAYRYNIPSALQAKTIKSVAIGLFAGGCTLLEYGADANNVAYPLYADTWSYSGGILGLRLSTSWWSRPYDACKLAQSTVYFNALTSVADGEGANIVFDSGGYWTRFDRGDAHVYAPSAVATLLTGAEYCYLCAYPATTPAFAAPSGYSRVLHTQNARAGVPTLWCYA